MHQLSDAIRVIERISGLLASGSDLEELFDSAGTAISEIIGARRWSIMLRTSTDFLRIHASKGIPAEIVERAQVRVGVGIAGSVAATGVGGLLRNAQQEAPHCSGGQYTSPSAICVPIRFKEEILGVLNLNDKHSGQGSVIHFDEDDLSVSMIIANQLGFALEMVRHADLYQELNELNQMQGVLEGKIGTLQTRDAAFDIIRKVTDALIIGGEIDLVLQSVIEGTTKLLGARRGTLMLLDPETRTMRIKASVGVASELVGSVHISVGEGIAGRVVESGEGILMEDAASSRVKLLGHADMARVQQYRNTSAICVPLIIKQLTVGVLNINDRIDGSEFTDNDLFIAKVIANQAAVAIQAANLRKEAVLAASKRRDLEIANIIQSNFLPPAPSVPGMDIAGLALHCDETGGDYVDFITKPEPDGTRKGIYLICGDVSGHGVSAALIMATGRAFLHALLWKETDIADIMAQLNNLLDANTPPEQYMTLFFAYLDPGQRTLTYVSAGHEKAQWYRHGSGEIRMLEPEAMPLGMFPGGKYAARTVQLEANDVIVITTDGIREAVSPQGEDFGCDRLNDAILDNVSYSAAVITDQIRSRTHAFCYPEAFTDDVSIMVVKVLPD
ncbi:MAG: SpoIIE family protein phosphatase [Gammaproteobacteria bacterium]|nr:SpoIIE family protein phosphatase [Gammaproteobacteria bacterium]MBU1653986.1 SpoIIE family protein phosphatase [Gammaproteobacteria bacterium]MBU1960462.1 SpoIIE family protein phosphatase [Gammaproteobacteria bacterium]